MRWSAGGLVLSFALLLAPAPVRSDGEAPAWTAELLGAHLAAA